MTPSFTSWQGRVALVSESSSSSTGIGRYVHMLHTGLCEAKIDAVRVAPTVPTLPAVTYRLLRLLGRDLRAFLRNYPLWSAYPNADVYHLTSQSLAALLVLCRPKGKVVVTVHDIFPYMLRKDSRLRSSPSIDFSLIAMLGLKRADRLITISEYTKRCVVEHLGIPAERISVIYHGIDQQHFRPLAVPAYIRERYRLPEGRRYLIYVGSEDPRKNLVTLVQALARVRRGLPDVELIKVGRSHFQKERHHLMQLATYLGVRAFMHFLEDVPEPDLPLLYNLADVCVMPSLYEGFGFPVLEAMACGTPVVCANAGSLRELVGDAGVQVCPHDVESLASNLVTLLNSTEKQAILRRTGYDRAASFPWTATIQNTAAVYKELLRNNCNNAFNRCDRHSVTTTCKDERADVLARRLQTTMHD